MTRAMHNPALMLLNDSPRLPLIAALAVRFAAIVTKWERQRRSRINLSKLDDRLLQDVQNTDLMAARQKRVCRMRAYEARAAGDENFHDMLSKMACPLILSNAQKYPNLFRSSPVIEARRWLEALK